MYTWLSRPSIGYNQQMQSTVNIPGGAAFNSRCPTLSLTSLCKGFKMYRKCLDDVMRVGVKPKRRKVRNILDILYIKQAWKSKRLRCWACVQPRVHFLVSRNVKWGYLFNLFLSSWKQCRKYKTFPFRLLTNDPAAVWLNMSCTPVFTGFCFLVWLNMTSNIAQVARGEKRDLWFVAGVQTSASLTSR